MALTKLASTPAFAPTTTPAAAIPLIWRELGVHARVVNFVIDALGGAVNATQLQGRALAATAPTDDQALAWNNTGTKWEPTSHLGLRVAQRVPASCAHTFELAQIGSDSGGNFALKFLDEVSGSANNIWLYTTGGNTLYFYFDNPLGGVSIGGDLEVVGVLNILNMMATNLGVDPNAGTPNVKFSGVAPAGDLQVECRGVYPAYRAAFRVIDGTNSRVDNANAIAIQGKTVTAPTTDGDILHYNGSSFQRNGQLKVNSTGVGFYGAPITTQQLQAAATNTKSSATFDTTTVTLAQLAARVGNIIDILRTYGLCG